MVSLCKRAVDMSDATLMDYVTEAYPLVVFCKQLENKQRRLMEIMECEILPDGTRQYNPIFRYHITENRYENGKYTIEGYHQQERNLSPSLQRRLIDNGMPQSQLEKHLKESEVKTA
ncbi:MAG: type II secretion system protein E, partial [Oscillospiraceae bacterium]